MMIKTPTTTQRDLQRHVLAFALLVFVAASYFAWTWQADLGQLGTDGPNYLMMANHYAHGKSADPVYSDNAAYSLEMRGIAKAERAARVAPFLEMIGLTRFRDHYPQQLSGGMRQRVSLARALVADPEILLMDEPFAALDALTRRTCQDELLQLWAETKFTVLFVTHSIAEAIKIGNRILLLSPHPGRVKAEIVDVDQVSSEDGSAGRLEQQIHDLLFTETATAH